MPRKSSVSATGPSEPAALLNRARGTVACCAFTLLLGAVTGCGGATIQPGHRGLLFDPDRGLGHEVLAPGYHSLRGSARIDDFDAAAIHDRVLVAERAAKRKAELEILASP